MAKQSCYIAIDIGSSKICSVVAQVGTEGELKILGTGVVPSRGVLKGRVEDPVQVQDAVRTSLEEAQRYVGRGVVAGVYASVGGAGISSVNTMDPFGGRAGSGALAAASMLGAEDGRELIHQIPTGYHVDGLASSRSAPDADGGSSAPGSSGPMDAEVHLISGDPDDLDNIITIIQGCKVSLHSLVAQGLASAEATLNGYEKELGTVLVDIGGGTMDVVIYRQGHPWYTGVIPVGGNQVTNDLSVVMDLPWDLSEEIKVNWGSVMPELIRHDEEVVVPAYERDPERVVKRRAVCLPLQARFEEMLKLILLKVRESGAPAFPAGGLVITGGAADLHGVKELAERTLGGPVRIGCPSNIPGLATQLSKPQFSAAVGLLLWGIQNHGEKRSYKKPEKTSRRKWLFWGRDSSGKEERQKEAAV